MAKRNVTAEEAAVVLGFSRTTIYNLIESEELPKQLTTSALRTYLDKRKKQVDDKHRDDLKKIERGYRRLKQLESEE